ncbi:hypothetical protein ACKI1K_44910, partial [Streptomyces scabiei]
AFATAAANLTGGGTSRQIVVRDSFTGALALVSSDASGVAGNADSAQPAFAADGRTLGFISRATNLAAYLPAPPAGTAQLWLASNPLSA